MTKKRKHKRTAKRPPARQRAARRRALGKGAPFGPGDSRIARLLPLCASIGMSLAVRAMCVLEQNWDLVEDSDPDETMADICDAMGDDGVLIQAVLSAALRYQSRTDPKEIAEMAEDVIDLLDELHELVHGEAPELVNA